MFPKNKKVIFIGGSSFSGSTMLDMMMANSPDGFSVGEAYVLFHPFRPHHFKPECGCENPDCNFWLQVRKAGEKNFYKTIFTLLDDISFIVDSSKELWWIKKQSEYLQAQGITVFHLLIWKEPAAFAYSNLKRNRENWRKFWINYYRLYFTLIKDYVKIAYSDLVQHPDIILQDLCSKTGLNFHQNQKKFWEKKHHTLFGNASAKIHLKDVNNRVPKQHKEGLENQEIQHQHQSIYYDTSYLKRLPVAIKNDIENDTELKHIVSILQEKKGPSSEIDYSPTQLALIRTRWTIKSLVGRIFGRYREFY
ncbi:MAG: hypothetical protein DRI95_07100 [Bacteroidetes bacterium]|nr:MAG: hypothetical protein DRI95_07100 [Bacteroidota bacterium]